MPEYKNSDYVIPIGNVSRRGERGEVRGRVQGKSGWYLVRFQDGTEEVYETDNLQLAARRAEDSRDEE
jgi:hypothetical protein